MPLDLLHPRLPVRQQKRSKRDELGEPSFRRQTHLAPSAPPVIPVQQVRAALGVRLGLGDLSRASNELGNLLRARAVTRHRLKKLPGDARFVGIRVERRRAGPVGP